MTKQTEALKMAIEALDTLMMEKGSIYQQALQACKEALAQPSIAELNDEYLRDTHVEGLQPAQEPVAWISVDDKLPEFVTVNNYEKSSDDILILIDGKHVYVGSWIYDNWSKTNDFCMRDLDGGYEVVDGMKVTHWMPLPKAPNEINTHPAPVWQGNKEFVGLSDDEIHDLMIGKNGVYYNFARAIESMLKDKNYDN